MRLYRYICDICGREIGTDRFTLQWRIMDTSGEWQDAHVCTKCLKLLRIEAKKEEAKAND